ncbi:MAG: PAS domain-containing sensor histidine kinase [Saprospiraceae bacterium]|nr:PAS domain-containing sensor histidine kinase [Saprospiraceae bacterium]
MEDSKALTSVFETVIDAIVIIDSKGTMVRVNQAGAKLFGYDQDEMLGRNVSMVMPEPDHSRHDGYLRNYIQTGDAKIIGIGREVTALRKDGTKFPVRLAVSKVYIDNQLYFTGILHDLTKIKEAERKILELNHELEEKVHERTRELSEVVNRLLDTNQKLKYEVEERAKVQSALLHNERELKIALEKEKELNELKTRFVSMASHEFRTPLSTILSSASLINRYTDAEQQERREKHISKIKNSVAHLTNLLNDFLSISKIEEGKLRLHQEPIEINAFCKDIIEEISLNVKDGQHVHCTLLPEPAVLRFDKTMIRTILYNLLSNASKYSAESTVIELKVGVEDEHLELTVLDEGIGIPESEQKHLFDRFFRATNAGSIQGTGLGLHIVKRYVDLIGGNITFTSRQFKGSAFNVKLPLQHGEG